MEEEQINILRTKSFDELSDSERLTLQDWCASEEEFLDLQHLFLGVEGYKAKIDNQQSNRKQELDALFTQVYYQNAPFSWKQFFFPSLKPLFFQPGFQLAFGVLLFFGLTFYFNTNFDQNQQVAKLEKKVPQIKEKELKPTSLSNSTSETSESSANDLLKKSENKTYFEEPLQVASSDMADEVEKIAFAEDLNFESTVSMNAPASVYAFTTKESLDKDMSDGFAVTGQKYNAPSNIKPVSERQEILDLLFTTY
jgi:hypothetical protein